MLEYKYDKERNCYLVLDEAADMFLGEIEFVQEFNFYPTEFIGELTQEEMFSIADKLKELNENL